MCSLDSMAAVFYVAPSAWKSHAGTAAQSRVGGDVRSGVAVRDEAPDPVSDAVNVKGRLEMRVRIRVRQGPSVRLLPRTLRRRGCWRGPAGARSRPCGWPPGRRGRSRSPPRWVQPGAPAGLESGTGSGFILGFRCRVVSGSRYLNVRVSGGSCSLAQHAHRFAPVRPH